MFDRSVSDWLSEVLYAHLSNAALDCQCTDLLLWTCCKMNSIHHCLSAEAKNTKKKKEKEKPTILINLQLIMQPWCVCLWWSCDFTLGSGATPTHVNDTPCGYPTLSYHCSPIKRAKYTDKHTQAVFFILHSVTDYGLTSERNNEFSRFCYSSIHFKR